MLSCNYVNIAMAAEIRKRFNNSLTISEFTRICMDNQSSVTGWQELFSQINPSNFGWPLQSLRLIEIRLKIYRLPNFKMLFQLVLI